MQLNEFSVGEQVNVKSMDGFKLRALVLGVQNEYAWVEFLQDGIKEPIRKVPISRISPK